MEEQEIRINQKFISIVQKNPFAENPELPISKTENQSTNIFLKKLNERYTVSQSGLIPRNCRYLEKIGARTLVVIEEPPSVRTLFYYRGLTTKHREDLTTEKIKQFKINLADYDSDPCNFTVALPYIIYIMMFDKTRLEYIYMAVRPKPIISLTDNLFVPPFPNINSSSSVCLGDGVNGSPNIIVATDQVVKRFWASQFNTDYTTNFYQYEQIPIIGNLFEWQYMTEVDPMFIYKVDWIPMDHTCLTFITLIKSSVKSIAKPLTYAELFNIFSTKQKYSTKRKSKKVKVPDVYEDVSNGINLLRTKDEPTLYLYVGDSIIFKDKTYFVDTFLGSNPDGPSEYVRFVGENNKYIVMKLTKKTRAFLTKLRKKQLYEEKVVLANGLEVQSGDVLVLHTKGLRRKHYKKILYIRKTPEGNTEIRASDRYLIAESISKDVEKLDLKNVIANGVKLVPGEQYTFAIKQSPVNAASQLLTSGNFIELSVNTSDSLIARFRGKIGEISVPFNDSLRVMHNISYEKLPEVICMGRAIVYSPGQMYRNENVLYHTDGLTIPSDALSSFERTCNNVLKDDSLIIKSNCLDFSFSVGDDVIVSSWDKPIEMLKIKKIIGITTDKTNRIINFYLEDKDGKKTLVPYVDKNSVNIGSVRKIVKEYNGLKRGSKISAKEYLNGFEKDSVNIIIGFLIDAGTPQPLVFCSNGLTLWFDDIQNNFDIIERNSTHWTRLNHNPINLGNIEFQAGDLVQCSAGYAMFGGFILYRFNAYDYNMGACIARSILNFQDYYNIDKIFLNEMRYNGILNPRLTKEEKSEKCLPNFHGGFYKTPFIDESSYQTFFQPGKGRLFDVSDSN